MAQEYDIGTFLARRTGEWSHTRRNAAAISQLQFGNECPTERKNKETAELARSLQLLPGQAVYEPFMRSGTTLIAAEVTGKSATASS